MRGRPKSNCIPLHKPKNPPFKKPTDPVTLREMFEEGRAQGRADKRIIRVNDFLNDKVLNRELLPLVKFTVWCFTYYSTDFFDYFLKNLSQYYDDFTREGK